MDFNSLFWIFLIIISLQPLISQKLINSARQRMIGRIEKKRNSRVILIVHRQESIGLLGIPLVRYINMEDSEAVLRALETTELERPVDIVLHTPGGLVLAALQIARAINRRKGKVRVIVPHYAMSGGTLIALAANEIVMSPFAVLGPIDPQLGNYPAPSLVKLRNEKDINKIDDNILILADLAQKAIDQLRASVEELLSENYGPEKAKELSALLTEGRWTHDYPITADYAKTLGLKVSTTIPDEFLALMSMYPQPTRTRPNVEYLERGNEKMAKMQ